MANYNKEDCLDRFFSSLLASSYKNFEVIFIDDASTDQSVDIAKKYLTPIHINSNNMGPAASRNKGAQYASGDIFLFCDSDIIFQRETLSKIIQTFQKEDIETLTGKMVLPPVTPNLVGYFWNIEFMEVCEKANLTKGHFKCWSSTLGAIKRENFLMSGGFNEKYKGADIEDHELSFRLARNTKMYYDDDVQFHHNFESATLVLKKAFKRSFQLAQLEYNLEENPGFNYHRRIGYLISLAIVLSALFATLNSSFLFLLIGFLILRLIHHRRMFVLAFNEKGITLFIFSYFYGIIVALFASFGFFLGTFKKRVAYAH